jgi:hypothetical protein
MKTLDDSKKLKMEVCNAFLYIQSVQHYCKLDTPQAKSPILRFRSCRVIPPERLSRRHLIHDLEYQALCAKRTSASSRRPLEDFPRVGESGLKSQTLRVAKRWIAQSCMA